MAEQLDRQPASPSLKAVSAPAPARKVARKAVSEGLGESLEQGGDVVGEQLAGKEGPAKPATNPGQLAEEGFQGTPMALPYRAEMEQSFGVSFAGVQAYADEHARRATQALNAKAYAVGNKVAFNSPTPDKALVAHELTHVLQHTGQGPAKKSEGGGEGEIETSGEAEAEEVEAAVASGKPARSALGGDGGEGSDKPARSVEGAKAPNLKSNKAPALSKFGTGMSFSPTAFEKSYTYDLWKAGEIEIPIPAVPGLNFMVEPSVRVKVGGGVNWKKKSVSTNVGVEGGVGVGFSYGNSKLASVYGAMEATVHGGFTYERTQGDTSCENKWELEGAISLATNFAVGVKLGGGILDAKFAFGQCDIGKLTGLHWENGNFNKNKIGWAWGDQPKAFFAKIKAAINEAKRILELPKKAAKAAWKGASSAVKKAGGIIKKLDLTPWDGVFPW